MIMCQATFRTACKWKMQVSSISPFWCIRQKPYYDSVDKNAQRTTVAHWSLSGAQPNAMTRRSHIIISANVLLMQLWKYRIPIPTNTAMGKRKLTGKTKCTPWFSLPLLPLETITWSSMTLSAFITSLWMNFSPLFFTAPTHFIEVCGYSFMHHCPVVRPSFGQANLCFGLVCPTDCVPEVGWFV